MPGTQDEIQSSEIVADKTGRQYHIDLAPGELAEYILLVGDPQRADKISSLFDSIELQRHNREFRSFTGVLKNTRISVISTGIGTDNVEIVVIEAAQITKSPSFIRVGSCGSLQPEVGLGDLVISSGAVRLENTSLFFVDQNYPAISHYEVNLALMEAADKLKVNYHYGLTASASGFYGAQGREVPGFPPIRKDLPEFLATRKVINFEMESSTLFTLTSLSNLRSGTVCAVYANRPKGTFIDPKMKVSAEENACRCGIEAARILEKMDIIKRKENKKNWVPSLSSNTHFLA